MVLPEERPGWQPTNGGCATTTTTRYAIRALPKRGHAVRGRDK